MRRLAAIALVSVLAVGAAGCGEKKNGFASVPGLEEDFPGQPRDSARIPMREIAFEPGRVPLRTGAEVTWVNRDRVAHTVTEGTELNPKLDSGEVEPGGSFSHRFDEPGDVEYRCTIHTQMRGKLRVVR
ncbi:MAG TPA: plastocyanin/azurin family copper-binding protein [Thermoleophilaceae bacterium]|nr:plastocyanin/azurin family copper-binding protein [Thermoleophilaceae bacterium]